MHRELARAMTTIYILYNLVKVTFSLYVVNTKALVLLYMYCKTEFFTKYHKYLVVNKQYL